MLYGVYAYNNDRRINLYLLPGGKKEAQDHANRLNNRLKNGWRTRVEGAPEEWVSVTQFKIAPISL